MQPDAEYNENEVLTGAELYLYLLRQNEEQIERAQSKLREYSSLKETLQVLTERSRRRVLAPVAGGLAYFPAELNATNTILVLLGDSWFAERSAVQAAEIAGRRLDFLRREAEVLQQEQTTLRSKQELFLSEMPEAQDAVAQLLAEKDAQHAGLVKEAAPSTATSAASASAPLREEHQPTHTPAPAASPANTDDSSKASVALTEGRPPHEQASTPSPAAAVAAGATLETESAEANADLDYAAVDAALATFDEQDDLTEEELIALEKELGDRLDDDAYVEQVMTERMIEKKERRVRAELERRQAAASSAKAAVEPSRVTASTATTATTAPPSTTQTTPPPAPAAVPSHPTSEVPSAAERENTVNAEVAATYRTPGDIGEGGVRKAAMGATSTAAVHTECATTSVVPPFLFAPPLSPAVGSDAGGAGDAAASPTTSTCSSSSRKERHVHFHDEVAAKQKHYPALPPSSQQPEAPPAVDTFSKREEGEEGEASASQPSPSLLRSTYRIGDIVEHSVEQRSAAAPPPPLLPTQRQKPKRKSLFMRDLEGDAA